MDTLWEGCNGQMAALGQQHREGRVGDMACPHGQSKATIGRGMMTGSQAEAFTVQS